MPKEQLNMRVDNNALVLFKSLIGKRGKNQAEVFDNIVTDASQGKSVEIISAQLQESQNNLELKEKELDELRKKSGIEKKEYERIYFKVTPEQKQNLTSMAHKLEIPRTELMIEFFLKQNKSELKTTIPELENIESESQIL